MIPLSNPKAKPKVFHSCGKLMWKSYCKPKCEFYTSISTVFRCVKYYVNQLSPYIPQLSQKKLSQSFRKTSPKGILKLRQLISSKGVGERFIITSFFAL
jgi:hypothetical protein